MNLNGKTVAITAANSAVGQAMLRLEEPGPLQLRALVRSKRAARQLPPLSATRGQIVQISYSNPESLQQAFEEAIAVVHLAGILVERAGSSYRQANVETTRAVVQAAARAGVEKMVLVSAVGADPGSDNGYYRSKGEAEELVRGSGLPYTILRVPLLLGLGTEGAAALRRNMASRLVFLVGGGKHLQQPLEVRDLARAALVVSAPLMAPGMTLDLVGPVCLPERDILMRAARLKGRQLRVVGVPLVLIRLALTLKARMGGGGFSGDVLEVITGHREQDAAKTATLLGMRLTGLEEMIRHSLESSPDDS